MKLKLDKCLGIPVYYDDALTNISYSFAFWRWNKIVVGPAWRGLPEREAGAVLLHEAGHVKLRHFEKRLRMLWLVFVNPGRLLGLCAEQEFQADRFAAECGYGVELAQLFCRLQRSAEKRPDSGPLHPDLSSRIMRLTTPAKS